MITGYNCVKRGYKGNIATFGVMSGVQAGVPVGKSFLLNPFLLMMPSTAFLQGEESDNDLIELDKNIQVGTSGGGQVVSNRVGMNRAIAPFSLGANLTYKPWGLTANLTGSLMTPLLANMMELSSYQIWKFQLSKSFGTFGW